MYRYKATAGVDNMKTVNVPVHVIRTPGFFSFPTTAPGPGIPGALSAAYNYAESKFPETKVLNLLDPVARSTMWNKRMAEDLKLIPAATKTN